MSYITADDGVRLYFETRGAGPQIVIPNGIIYLDDFAALAADHTLIAYEPRNRGRSDATGDGDIGRDVEDVEAVRRHFDIGQMNLIGHSYVGLLVALYGMRHPGNVRRIVQIGPMEPVAGKQYPPELSNHDGLTGQIFGKLGQLYQTRTTESDEEMCRKAWEILRPLYVTDPADAARINWGGCEFPNERGFMMYFTGRIMPSIRQLNLAEEASGLAAPVLTIHGTKDRNAPYGAGRDWVSMLPNARLLTIEGGAHAPWIEAPDRVIGAMRTFFAGEWPEGL
jgi:pimeloyl-ACP methyl ester carboxylesterase